MPQSELLDRSILLLTPDLADNSTGRAFVLWALARSLGWSCVVAAPRGDRIWGPLRGTDFEKSCGLLPPRSRDARGELRHLGAAADLIVAVKPLPGSFGLGLWLERESGTPLLLDIDDPDIESRIGLGRPLEALGKAVLRPNTFWPALYLRSRVAAVPRMVSNPVLARRYGGRLVPHARSDSGAGTDPREHGASVVFVGTNRPHKGVGLLRRAVSELHNEGFSLTVTDGPPVDAMPWESWVGATSLEGGIDLVRHGDVVVVPSLPSSLISRAQLPVKLIDAMLAARAVVVADFEPLTWAIGDTGRVFKPGDLRGLVEALRGLAEPGLRRDLGRRARERALSIFSLNAVAREFELACVWAMGTRRRDVWSPP